MKEIDQFLKENKPIVKDNPTFILETRRRLENVEGIKAEVDRQRHSGRIALICALVAGLAIGVCAAATAFLYPVDPESLGAGLWESVRLFLHTWRQYILLPVAALAVALGIVLMSGSRQSA